MNGVTIDCSAIPRCHRYLQRVRSRKKTHTSQHFSGVARKDSLVKMAKQVADFQTSKVQFYQKLALAIILGAVLLSLPELCAGQGNPSFKYSREANENFDPKKAPPIVHDHHDHDHDHHDHGHHDHHDHAHHDHHDHHDHDHHDHEHHDHHDHHHHEHGHSKGKPALGKNLPSRKIVYINNVFV